MDAVGDPLDPRVATTAAVERFVADVDEPAAKADRIVALNWFYCWALDEGLADHSPVTVRLLDEARRIRVRPETEVVAERVERSRAAVAVSLGQSSSAW